MNKKEIKKNNLMVIISCYNEEESIQFFFSDLISYCKERKWSIIAVNDGSKDKTKELLSNLTDYNKFKLISYKVNKGYGAAVKTGIAKTKTEYCITIDADGQHCIKDITKLYDSIVKNDCDMVIGSRKNHES